MPRNPANRLTSIDVKPELVTRNQAALLSLALKASIPTHAQEIADHLMDIASGHVRPKRKVNTSDQLTAIAMIADRTEGKPMQQHQGHRSADHRRHG